MSRIEISKKRILVNSSSSAISLLINISVLVWLQQFLLKRITPEEYSLMPILLSIMAIAPLFTIVFTGGIGRFITVAYAQNDSEKIKQICSTMFPILLFVSVAFLLIGFIAAWHIDSLIVVAPELVVDAQIMFALLIFSAALRLPASVFGTGFIVTQKLYLEDMISVVCQLLRVIVLFSLLYGVSVRVLWVVVALVISDLLLLLITTPISLKLLPEQKVRWGKLDNNLAKEITNYGGWSFVHQISETIKQAFDPILLNHFVNSVAVSVFYVAGLVPRQLRLIVYPISRPFIPILASMCATRDYTRLRNTYLRVARYHAWLIISISIPAIAFSKQIIFLYLDNLYPDASKIMVVLVLVAVINTFNALGVAVVAADGQMKSLALRKLLMYVFNAVLAFVLVYYFNLGAYGVAVATLVSVLIIDVFIVWPFCRMVAHTTTKLWYENVILPCVTSSIPSIVFCIIISISTEVNTFVKLIIYSGVSGIVFYITVGLFGLRVQDKIDLIQLSKKLPKPINKVLVFICK